MIPRAGTRGVGARAVVALATVAAALTLYQVTRPGLLLGATPDVSVYLGGAVRLVHGAIPYRDFVFVQPPGFVLLATPIAAVADLVGTREALGLLRLLTVLLAAGNVLLVGRLVRHRGLPATAVACTVMTCFPAELYAMRGPQLEPVADFFCLLGAALVFRGDSLAGRRRLGAGGVALGIAVAVKLSAAIPVAVLVLLCAAILRRRSLAVAFGAVGAFAVVTLPFLALAAPAFWHDAVTTQLERVPGTARAAVLERLSQLTGMSEIRGGPATVIAVTAALAGLAVGGFVVSRRPPTPLEWFALVATAAVAVAQLAPAQYYPQYAALLAPFLSLLLGLSAARAFESVRRPRGPLVAAVLACSTLTIAQGVYISGESAPDFARAVDAAVPAGTCTLSNAPVYLVTTDRFQPSVRDCTRMTDPAGTILALPPGTAEAVSAWREAFAHVDYVVTDRPIEAWQLPPQADIPTYVGVHFHLVHADSLLVYVRRGADPR